MSERRACAVLGQHRSTQRKVLHAADDEVALTASIIGLARERGVVYFSTGPRRAYPWQMRELLRAKA